MNIAKYKRIRVEIPDVATKPFHAVSFHSSAEDKLVYKDIHQYLESADSEYIDGILEVNKATRQKNTGLGRSVRQDFIDKKNSGFYLSIEQSTGEDDYTSINYVLGEENDVLYDMNIIDIADDVKANVVINYEGGQRGSFRSGFYHVNLGSNSELNLIKVQNLDDDATNLETITFVAGEKSKLNYYPVEIGSGISLTSSSTYQIGDWTEISIFPLFLVDETKKADYEQNLIINGKNSLGIINAKGCVKDKGTKVFRGNVFLNRGCKRSIGRFSDKSIIMNPGIKAHTIPTIFCDEDDVIGEHAGSFEPLKNSELYYLMNRGFDKKEARKVLVKSSFMPALNMIKNDELREKLIYQIDQKLLK